MTVYTANLGDYDEVRAPQAFGSGDRFLCYTDAPEPAPEPWVTLPAAQPVPGDHARNVRIHKALSHRYAPGEISLWHDANFQLHASAGELAERWLGDGEIAVFQHPGRDCLYGEADCCARENIENAAILERQVKRYRDDGWPEHAGLYACGVILRRHTQRVVEFNEAWWKEIQEHGRRDQISFPYLAARAGLDLRVIPGSIWGTPEVRFFYHTSWGVHEFPCECKRCLDNGPLMAVRAERFAGRGFEK